MTFGLDRRAISTLGLPKFIMSPVDNPEATR